MIHLKRQLGKPLKPIETNQLDSFNYILWSIHIHFAYCFLIIFFVHICHLFPIFHIQFWVKSLQIFQAVDPIFYSLVQATSKA